jgi:hypothetical protein
MSVLRVNSVKLLNDNAITYCFIKMKRADHFLAKLINMQSFAEMGRPAAPPSTELSTASVDNGEAVLRLETLAHAR